MCVASLTTENHRRHRAARPTRQLAGITAPRPVARTLHLKDSPAVLELQLFVWKRRVRAVSRVLYQDSVAEGHALFVSLHLSYWLRGRPSTLTRANFTRGQRPHLVSTHNASFRCAVHCMAWCMGVLIDQVHDSYGSPRAIASSECFHQHDSDVPNQHLLQHLIHTL